MTEMSREGMIWSEFDLDFLIRHKDFLTYEQMARALNRSENAVKKYMISKKLKPQSRNSLFLGTISRLENARDIQIATRYSYTQWMERNPLASQSNPYYQKRVDALTDDIHRLEADILERKIKCEELGLEYYS